MKHEPFLQKLFTSSQVIPRNSNETYLNILHIYRLFRVEIVRTLTHLTLELVLTPMLFLNCLGPVRIIYPNTRVTLTLGLANDLRAEYLACIRHVSQTCWLLLLLIPHISNLREFVNSSRTNKFPGPISVFVQFSADSSRWISAKVCCPGQYIQ